MKGKSDLQSVQSPNYAAKFKLYKMDFEVKGIILKF